MALPNSLGLMECAWGGAILGLLLWAIFNSPTIAILAVIAVDMVGTAPTLHHAWLEPGEETWQTFAIISFATILTLMSLNKFSVASLSYPLYLLLANGLVALTVVHRRQRKNLAQSRK
jgi:hypothetical protein